MSRLIFRNLPATLSNDQFRNHLATPPSLKGTTVTDTKLVSKRRFAFVGYKTEEDAKRAQQWFDGSFSFGGGKVKVEVVRDEDLKLGERPAKRLKGDNRDKGDKGLKLASNQRQEKQATSGGDDNAAETAGDAQGQPEAGPSKSLQEFMQVMKGVDPTAPVPEAAQKADSKKGKQRDGTPPVEQNAVADDDDDAAWLAKRKANLGGLDDNGQVDVGVPVMHQDPDTALILSTGRLFLRNLSFITTSTDLRSLFEPFGALEEVHLPQSKTGEPLGTAFLLFREPSHALAAYRALDKKSFQGRLLHILPGRAKPGQAKDMSEVTEGAVLGKVKDTRQEVLGKKEEKRKGETARGVNWASLYMNSDAVAASVAAKMGISKSDLLSSDASGGSSAAVKLALAETAVIADTKKYFLDAGIVIDALQPNVPRSQTILLIKNIPFGTSVHTLSDMFAPHGDITRLLLPPSGTLGVVEYKTPQEAQSAFKALSYKRIGSAVLYLEKGPQGMFKKDADSGVQQSAEDKEKTLLAERAAAAAGLPVNASANGTAQADETDSSAASRERPSENDEAGSTLFLKNLSFTTSSLRLQSVLSSLPGFSFARVQTKPDPKRPGEKLSMGYGFVGFTAQDAAKKGLRALEGFEVDGKVLEPRFAQRGAEDVERENSRGGDGKGKKEGKEGDKKSTKLLVKNLPFEATKKDVRELFSAYGTLKSLRLPRKPTLTSTGAQSGRGFAFCEFTTHAEAQRAMDALKHTHLLGRHLVIQWAAQGDDVDVDALREKVGRDVRGMEDFNKGKGGKRKFELGGAREEDDGLEV